MVLVFLANGFEEIEAIAPVDLLRRAGVDTATVGIGSQYIRGTHGIEIKADLYEEEALDQAVLGNVEMIVLPGGMPGAENLNNSKTLEKIMELCDKNKAYMAAICAAPLVLGEHGYLKGKKATCYPGYEDRLGSADYNYASVVHDGNIITADSMGSAIDFALALVRELKGIEAERDLRKVVLYE